MSAVLSCRGTVGGSTTGGRGRACRRVFKELMEETQRSVGDGQQSLDLLKGVGNVSVAWEVET